MSCDQPISTSIATNWKEIAKRPKEHHSHQHMFLLDEPLTPSGDIIVSQWEMKIGDPVAKPDGIQRDFADGLEIDEYRQSPVTSSPGASVPPHGELFRPRHDSKKHTRKMTVTTVGDVFGPISQASPNETGNDSKKIHTTKPKSISRFYLVCHYSFLF